MAIRILIADASPAVRNSIGRLLHGRADVLLAGEASNYAETIAQMRALRPDVLLLDLQMPASVGFQPEKIERFAAGIPCAVIAMSTWADQEATDLALRLGANVKLDKKSLADELLPAILSAAVARVRQDPPAPSLHQCFMFNGDSSYGLARIAAAAKQRLDDGYRCLYLNSPSMVAAMRAHLVISGVDLADAMSRTSILLSSDVDHLVDGHFDMNRMLALVREGVEQAVTDGFKGLWAAGDITWELGPERDFSRLLEYEWRLEEMFGEQPYLSGVCQYHAAAVPREALQDAAASHSSIFINEKISRVNPRYVRTDSPAALLALDRSGLDEAVDEFCSRPSR